MYESLQSQYGRLISAAVPCPQITPEQFLAAHEGTPRFFYAAPQNSLIFAGTGMALELNAWGVNRFATIRHEAIELFAEATMLNEAPTYAAPRLFGGFAFLDDFTPDYAWADFTPAHFVLPHYQLLRQGGETWLTINAHIPFGESPLELLPDLEAALHAKIAQLVQWTASNEVANSSTLVYPMPYETWAQHITDATRRMQAGELNKVVLARVCELQFAQRVNVLPALVDLTQTYPDTYRFLFEPRPYHAFFGATPELLVTVNGLEVNTMALAGSIRRGTNPAEDKVLGMQLLQDMKNRYEHELVIEGIRARLAPLTKTLEIGTTGLKQLSNIQHIYTPISGILQHNDGILPLVAALHPTPALGGDPREIAVRLIGEYEPVPRGWYAAPLGWLDRDQNGQFAVAIRSAVAQEQRVWLYAGAGIVRDSEPQAEWDETGLKFRAILQAISR